MTIFIVRLQVNKRLSKREAYLVYGDIATSIEDFIEESEDEGLVLLDITDDTNPPPPAQPLPAKPRKPRGKNKPKMLTPVSANTPLPSQTSAPNIDIPASLRRTAE